MIIANDEEDTGQGGPVFHPTFPLTPRVWDGDGGPDNWRVQFSLNGLKSVEQRIQSALLLGAIGPARKAELERLATYKVMISLRAGVAWTERQPLALTSVRVDPQELDFLKHDGTLELPDFGITDTLILP